MNTYQVKGIVADKTYVILNGATSISDILYYTEIVKDEEGKRYKRSQPYFELEFGGYFKLRFEMLRGTLKPHMAEGEGHTYIVYVDEPLEKSRKRIIQMFKTKKS